MKLYFHKTELLHITARIVWNRNVFDNYTVYSCKTELFEMELVIHKKKGLTLNNKDWYAIKPNKPNQTKQSNCFWINTRLVVLDYPHTCWWNFLSLFWKVLFCFYCLTLSRYLMSLLFHQSILIYLLLLYYKTDCFFVFFIPKYHRVFFFP